MANLMKMKTCCNGLAKMAYQPVMAGGVMAINIWQYGVMKRQLAAKLAYQR
jgi:hypothetical protein